MAKNNADAWYKNTSEKIKMVGKELKENYKDEIKQVTRILIDDINVELNESGRIASIPTTFVMGYLFATTGKLVNPGTIHGQIKDAEIDLAHEKKRGVEGLQKQIDELQQQIETMKKKQSTNGDNTVSADTIGKPLFQ